MICLTRRYRFSASHRLHCSSLSSAENARLFGKCNNPYGHGHDYVLEVSVTGEVDPLTGLLLPVAALNRLIDEKVLRVVAFRNLNLDLPQFQNLIATTENLAVVIVDLIQHHWREYLSGTSARLSRVYIQETERNGFEVLLPASKPQVPDRRPLESVVVHA